MAADGSVVISIEADESRFKSTLSKLGNTAEGALSGIKALLAETGAALAGIGAGAAGAGLGDFPDALARLGEEAVAAASQTAADAMSAIALGLSGGSAAESGRLLMLELAHGVQSGAPTVLAEAPTLVGGFAGALLGERATMAASGEGLLTALVDRLPRARSAVAGAAAPAVVGGLAEAFLAKRGDMAESGEALFLALVRELGGITETVSGAAAPIVSGLVGAFRRHGVEMETVGQALVSGVWTGISSMGGWLGTKVESFFGGIVGGVKNFLGIRSPSRVFAELGGYTVAGFAEGVDGESGAAGTRVRAAMEDLTAEMIGASAERTFSDAASATGGAFCETFGAMRGDFVMAGEETMDGLDAGLRNRGGAAIGTARGIADSIVSEMRRALAIHSPSRKLRDLVGKPAAEGFLSGFETEMGTFHDRMQRAVDRELGGVNAAYAARGSADAARSWDTGGAGTRTIEEKHVVSIGIDPDMPVLAREFRPYLKAEERRAGASLAEGTV